VFIDDVMWWIRDDETERWLVESYKTRYKATFAPLSVFVGMQIKHDREHGVTRINQPEYIERACNEIFGDDWDKKAPPSGPSCAEIDKLTGPVELSRLPKASKQLCSRYRQCTGKLNFLQVSTRPDLAQVTGRLCRANANPSQELLDHCHNVLRYAWHTKDCYLEYKAQHSAEPLCYSDSDWCTSNATAAWCVGMCGGPVLWASKRERCVALSSTEAELVAASMAACEVVFLRNVLGDCGVTLEKPTTLYCDNSGAVEIARTPLSKTKLKHILRRYFYVREVSESGEVLVVPVNTVDNISDVMTKHLNPQRFKHLVARLMKNLR